MARKIAPKVEALPSRRDDLVKLRAKLMDMIELAEPSVVAQIAGQLRQVIKELDELPDEAQKSDLDLAREQRAKRRAGLKAV
jgi:hypothetical protein